MIVSATFLSGCAQPALSPGRYEVLAPRTAFFKHGPAQGTGPDVSLSRGDQVEVLASERGYSRVRLGDGKEGYVLSAALLARQAEVKSRRGGAEKREAVRTESATAPPEESPFPPPKPEEAGRPSFRL